MNGLLPSAIKRGWKETRTHLLLFIPLLIVSSIILAIPDMLIAAVKSIFHVSSLGLVSLNFSNPPLAVFVLCIIVLRLVLTALVSTGFVRILLDMLDGKLSGKMEDILKLFVHWRLIPTYIIGYLLYGLMVLLGVVFFIVPGIIIAFVFCLWQFFLVDKNYGPIKALQASMIATRGMRWALFLYIIALMLLNVAGVLAVGIGIFLTIPVTIVAFAVIYRHLSARMEMVPEKIEPSPRVSRVRK